MLGGMLGTVTGSFAGGVASSDPAHGVVRATDFAVTQNGTPNMSVNVAAGGAFIRGTLNANQGAYHVWNDGTVNLSVTAADATNGRQDLVIAQVRDAAYSGATNDARITVVTGTAAASPVDPSLASFPNALVLARITVAAGDTNINTADITDLRPVANQVGKIPTFNTSALATAAIPSPVDGQAYYLNLNTDQEGVYFFNGSQYRRPWNMPWGVVGRALITSATAATAVTLVTGSSLSIPQVARRVYKYTVTGYAYYASVNDGFQVAISNGSGTNLNVFHQLPIGAGTIYANSFGFSFYEVSTATATVTRDLRLSRFYGTSGNVTFFADATRIGSFIVEDIGPSGAPA